MSLTTTDHDLHVDLDLRDRNDVTVTVDTAAHSDHPTDSSAAPAAQELLRVGVLRRLLPLTFWVVTFLVAGLLFLPTLLGFSRYAIVGGSMSPTFDKGSAVFSEQVPVTSLEVGDVITFVPPPQFHVDTLVTHRIHEVTRADDGAPLFHTKGDANQAADPWAFTLDAPNQDVVRFSVPMLGYALVKLADPAFRQLVIAVPAAFIALGALFELVGIDPGALLRRRRTIEPGEN